MYQPSHFEENRPEVLHALLRTHPLAMLVTLTAQGLEANHIPLVLRTTGVDRPTLVGHVARANPLWRETDRATPVLAIFQGPQHYISPGRARQGGAHVELRRGARQRHAAGTR